MSIKAAIGAGHSRGAARRVLCTVASLLAVSGGLFLAACTSEADLVAILSTETDSVKRQEAASDLAGRGSLAATEELVAAAATNDTAAAGLDALAEEYGALLEDEVTKASEAGEKKLGADKVTELRNVIECVAGMETGKAIEVLADFALVDGHKLSDATGLQIRALMGLSDLGTEEAVNALIDVGKGLPSGSSFDDLRDALVTCLGKCGEPAIALLLPLADDNEWAALGLVEVGSPAVAPVLASSSESKWMILGFMGADAVPALTEAMHAKDRETTLYAAMTLAYIAEYSTYDVQALVDALEQRDLKNIAANYLFYIAYGKEGSEQTIADALLAYGSKQMGLDCLNCGNETLAAAGREWGRKHGYSVHTNRGEAQSALPWGL